jgi:mRNA-degrading endonuclease toxin of MazEF toxin-antitoxin module
LPGNVLLPSGVSGLAKDSVIHITQLTVIDKSWLDELVVMLPRSIMVRIDHHLSLVLGL